MAAAQPPVNRNIRRIKARYRALHPDLRHARFRCNTEIFAAVVVEGATTREYSILKAGRVVAVQITHLQKEPTALDGVEIRSAIGRATDQQFRSVTRVASLRRA